MTTLQWVHSTAAASIDPGDITRPDRVKKMPGSRQHDATAAGRAGTRQNLAVPALVNLDGSLVAPREARVSVFDRGFLFGDSVYEVVRTYGGRPFELDAHLARLAGSARRIDMALRWDARRTAAEIDRTLLAARGDDEPAPDAAPWNVGERYVRIVMTRGSGELGLDPALACDPLAIVIVRPLSGPPARAYREGVAAVVVGDARPAGVDPAAKTGLHLPNVLAVKAARAAGAHEALLVDGRGFVTEGASSNLFAVRRGLLVTPPLGAGILEGVTRGVVLALAREAGVSVDERPVATADLAEVDEVFITSTVREIVPVTRLGDRVVGTGKPGPVTVALHRAFRARAGPATGQASL
jgi:branched-chain amino acid aminotransferase